MSSKRLTCALKQLFALLNPVTRYPELQPHCSNISIMFVVIKTSLCVKDTNTYTHILVVRGRRYQFFTFIGAELSFCFVCFLVLQNAQVTEAWNKIAQSFKCAPIEGEHLLRRL